MKLLLVALLVMGVRGRPQGTPQCGDVTISCTIDQVLIYDENSNSCACVGRSAVPSSDNPFGQSDEAAQVNRKRKQVDQSPVQSKPDADQQKPVTLPHQDASEVDQSKRQSNDDKKEDEVSVNKEEASKKKQAGQDGETADEEKPALAVDPVEVVKPVKPDRQQDEVVGEPRPLPVPEGEGVHIETKPAPIVVEKDQRRRRRQAEGEVGQAPVVEAVPLPLPVPAVDTEPVNENRRQSGQEVAEDPDTQDPVEPAAGKPVTVPAPHKETGRQNNQAPFFHRPQVKKPVKPVPKPEVPEQHQDSEVQERQSEAEFDFREPTFGVEPVQSEDEAAAVAAAQQPVQPVVDDAPLSGTDVAFHQANDFNGQPLLERRRRRKRMDERMERQEDGEDGRDVDEDNKKKRQVPHSVGAGQNKDGPIEDELQQEGQADQEKENKRKRKVPFKTAAFGQLDDGELDGALGQSDVDVN